MKTIKILALITLCALAACASSAVTALRDTTFTSSSMSSLACMPFVRGNRCLDASAGGDAFLDCRFSALSYSPEFYAPGALQEISAVLHEELRKKYGQTVKDYSAGVSVFETIVLRNPDKTLRALASAFGGELGAEYVVVGVLDSYIDRVGSARGISSPASVTFRLYIIHAPTGSTVFEGTFSETQQALTENILKAPSFFRRGARWLSAEELSREGIRRILADIP
ncbi:MAG: hypothetical protein FJ119_09930 [Deltaproteobacteria bacterium]|nr:hypothetical protein [Deltaproteobacteria bacterium]